MKSSSNLPDDVAQLISDVEFDLGAYREFNNRPIPKEAPRRGAPPPVVTAVARQPDAEIAALRALSTSMMPASAPLAAPPVVVQRSSNGGTFRALEAMMRQPPAMATERQPLPRTRKTTVALFAASGGCGVSTITATLARLLSENNESVSIVDNAPFSLLPAHFGARRFRSGLRSIVRAGAQGTETAIHLVSPPATGSRGAWLESSLEQLEGDYDRLLVDVAPDLPDEWLGAMLRDAVAVAPLLPDLRCAHSVEPMLARIEGFRKRFGVALPLYFVLSQFDANVRLHGVVRDWLTHAYSQQMLPLTLRRGEEVAEALADGMTVVDYAPNSGIAHDFRALAAWVRQLPAMEARQ